MSRVKPRLADQWRGNRLHCLVPSAWTAQDHEYQPRRCQKGEHRTGEERRPRSHPGPQQSRYDLGGVI